MDLEERFLGRANVETERSRVLVTLLFTDLVGSTERLVRLGDRDWYELLALHHRKVREHLDRFGGREVDTSGDGFLATFDTASKAVSSIAALRASVWRVAARWARSAFASASARRRARCRDSLSELIPTPIAPNRASASWSSGRSTAKEA